MKELILVAGFVAFIAWDATANRGLWIRTIARVALDGLRMIGLG